MFQEKFRRPIRVAWLLCSLFCASAAYCNVRLPRLIGENMVLQRDSKVAIWGWADPKEQIKIVFRGQKVRTQTSNDGRWSVSLGPFNAGGPYDMTIAGRNRMALHNILIGDVWLASGQSNMEVSLGPDETGTWKGVINADQEVARARFPQIRLFKVHNKTALMPIADAEADAWTSVTPETAAGFSAVAYFFGQEIHQRYDIPVGLIESSWGGTVAEAWVSAGSLKRFPEFVQPIHSLKNIDERAAVAEHEQYLKSKSEWYRQHGAEDRGRDGSGDLWAAPSFDTASWSMIDEPQTKPIDAINGFDGVTWFRKEITLPGERAGKDSILHLPGAYKRDVTAFFNGTRIGETAEGDKAKDYLVPGSLTKAGRNVVVVRLTGGDGFVGLYGDADRLNLQTGTQTESLAGMWSYQPGADLSDLPTLAPDSKLVSDPNTATVLYNGMIAPLVPYTLKGVIWYQGESNAIDNRSAQYRRLFPALIQDWRKQWGYDLPFLFVQLAGWPPITEKPAESPFAELREAQSMTLSLRATGMATAVDQPDDHPRDKRTVAHRLLLTAAKVVYGENILDSGPIFKSMQIEGSQIRIKFSCLGSGLRVGDKYGYARGFEVAGADGKFQWAQARQDGEDILVMNTTIQQPTTVRYDWSNTPDGNLFNRDGLPAVPFRTNPPKQ